MDVRQHCSCRSSHTPSSTDTGEILRSVPLKLILSASFSSLVCIPSVCSRKPDAIVLDPPTASHPALQPEGLKCHRRTVDRLGNHHHPNTRLHRRSCRMWGVGL